MFCLLMEVRIFEPLAHAAHVEVREQLVRVTPLLLPRAPGAQTGQHPWQEVL